jgi:hypothetical protein
MLNAIARPFDADGGTAGEPGPAFIQPPIAIRRPRRLPAEATMPGE